MGTISVCGAIPPGAGNRLKICRKCGCALWRDKFRVDKWGRVDSYCKMCRKELAAKWNKDNNEKVKARAARYREANRARVNEVQKAWNARNKDRVAMKVIRAQLKHLNADQLLDIIDELHKAYYNKTC